MNLIKMREISERDISVKKSYYACKEDDRFYNDREKVSEGGE